jgi:hypothetical protein
MFETMKSPRNQTKVKMQKTETGIKDRYLDFFLDKMASSYRKNDPKHIQQEALNEHVSKLTHDVYSPVWRIHGLDPHSDTPIDILHVFLLGFVKYFWRDVIDNHLKGNKAKHEALITRLSSCNVSGTGLSQLSGHTLVNYAGSLTGRDFRAIAQVAPFVLYDLVTTPCYSVWVSLSNLMPLVWQPEINNIDSHLVCIMIIL